MNLSPWFEPQDKPVHKGVYKVQGLVTIRRIPGCVFFAKWSGKHWGECFYWQCNAENSKSKGKRQDLWWCGVVK